MDKYTYEQIKKALECCANKNIFRTCEGCPLIYIPDCSIKLCELSIDLINRQEAEIDRLNNELRLKVEYIHEQRDVIDEKKAEIARLEKELYEKMFPLAAEHWNRRVGE